MAEIVDTSRMLDMVKEHPFMSIGLRSKLDELQDELRNLPQTEFEPKISLLFSGRAVRGAIGIKSSFVGKTIIPFQEMIKTQAALHRFGSVGRRGQAKSLPNSELFITALPVGSFGVELSQLESNDLFAERDISTAMKQVIQLIANIAESDELFESTIENIPNRHLKNLKRFLKEIVDEHSILKMESGEVGVVFSEEQVEQAYLRVASTVEEDVEQFIAVILRGILLDSGKFETLTLNGEAISGIIAEDLNDETLIAYDKEFLNKECIIHIQIHKTKFKTGAEKTEYELLQILQPSDTV
ncbi:MAG: hypothetical protein WC615_04910 [Mucilaginibacter sp.]